METEFKYKGWRMAPRHHVVITGTGRTGTTFLVELLTHLGINTGFRPEDLSRLKNEVARAGLEHDIREPSAPYLVKNPKFAEYAADVLADANIVIEHVLIPMRDLAAAAESRRHVTRSAVAKMPLLKRAKRFFHSRELAGGLWNSSSLKAGAQEQVLLAHLYQLVLALADGHIPVTLIKYPRLVHDGSYLYSKLKPILKNITEEDFLRVYDVVAQPDLVHKFSDTDQWSGHNSKRSLKAA